ncbi:MAG: GTP cyclohydrolase II RibA [Methylobacteriaceae bacterium]|nr:GTP cyclohydrolase II RibA [Methylobacteriaceae bacterium]
MFQSTAETSLLSVERAIAELRAGRPVLVSHARSAVLAAGVEAIDAELAGRLGAVTCGPARLVLPAARLRRLGLDRAGSGLVALPLIDVKRVARLAMGLGARIDAPVAPPDAHDEAALDLVRLALLAPAAVVAPVRPGGLARGSLVRTRASAIRAYRASRATDLHVVSRAPVPLESARDAEFVVFRGGEGLREQVAVLVGRPDPAQPVTVRLHSACLTGDLFSSLKCDCGDQLRRTVRYMAAHDGGILLYLDQEGRGNGIANKMRAYDLQAKGYDTYDADEVLGFEHDQRRFDFAARMLQVLGVTRVRLMTNNPDKIAALRKAGLDVVSDQRILGRPTHENVRFLASKRDRAGHFIDFDAIVAAARPPD